MNVEHDYRDVLLKAASLVEERWFQLPNEGGLVGGYCALTATASARIQLELDQEVELEADAALRKYLNLDDEDSVADWNDAEGRTADEVAEALRRAAE